VTARRRPEQLRKLLGPQLSALYLTIDPCVAQGRLAGTGSSNRNQATAGRFANE